MSAFASPLPDHKLSGQHMLSLEQFLKNVKRFSDKNCGKNKKVEKSGKSGETKTALDKNRTEKRVLQILPT